MSQSSPNSPTFTAALAQDAVLTPAQLAAVRPGLSVARMAKLRLSGAGPKYSKLSYRSVLYRLGDVDAWLETTRVSSTSEGR